jgi:hypothetical protein
MIFLLPADLRVNLKRFGFSTGGDEGSKISPRYEFDEKFDFMAFVGAEIEETRHRLIGTVVHRRTSASATIGHMYTIPIGFALTSESECPCGEEEGTSAYWLTRENGHRCPRRARRR